jgi:hypothetical protein
LPKVGNWRYKSSCRWYQSYQRGSSRGDHDAGISGTPVAFGLAAAQQAPVADVNVPQSSPCAPALIDLNAIPVPASTVRSIPASSPEVAAHTLAVLERPILVEYDRIHQKQHAIRSKSPCRLHLRTIQLEQAVVGDL